VRREGQNALKDSLLYLIPHEVESINPSFMMAVQKAELQTRATSSVDTGCVGKVPSDSLKGRQQHLIWQLWHGSVRSDRCQIFSET